MKTTALIPGDRAWVSIRSRLNPIRGLTPERLAAWLDEFRYGYFRGIGYVWDAISRRDGTIQSVETKRKRAPARLGWSIMTEDDSPASADQKEKLEYFYNNLEATAVLEPSVSGGVSTLLQQMMVATGQRYATHEIVWRPSPDGLTAQFRLCPLWFFEGTHGCLHFLANEFDIFGSDLAPGEWLVTTGDGLMEACCVLYLYKTLEFKDWLIFSERFGAPGLLGRTNSTPGQPQWEAMEESLRRFGIDFSAVINREDGIDLVETKNAGALPFPALIEYCDKIILTIWRGGDLSTQSKSDSVGGNNQMEESDILEGADCEMLSETLNRQVDKFVLEYHFGPGVKPLARFAIKEKEKAATDNDLKIDEAFVGWKIPLSQDDAYARYGRARPDPGEELLQSPAAPDASMKSLERGSPPDPSAPSNPPDKSASNEASNALLAAARKQLASARLEDLGPFLARLAAVADSDDATLVNNLRSLRIDLPKLLPAVGNTKSADVLFNTLSAALFNGLEAEARGESSQS